MTNEYITIPVNDPTLCSVLVTELVKLIETTEGLDSLLVHGCDPAVVDTVRHLKTRDLHDLVKATRGFCVALPLARLEAGVRHLHSIRSDQSLLEYFIRHRASRGLVMQLFKLSMTDVKKQRQLLQVEDEESDLSDRQSNKQRLSEQVSGQIQTLWNQIRKTRPEMPLRRQIYLLHQSFSDLTIQTVYRVAREFDHRPSCQPHRGGHRVQ